MQNMSDREIRQVLAERYDTHEKARIVAKDISLELSRIAYSPIMEVYWDNIWREAEFQHKERNLIDRALLDYPKLPESSDNNSGSKDTIKLSPQPQKKRWWLRNASNSTPNQHDANKPHQSFAQKTLHRLLRIKRLNIITTVIPFVLYIVAALLLLLIILLSFNILDPIIFLKKMLRQHPVILLLTAGLVVTIILGAIICDLITMLRKNRGSSLL